MADVVGGSCEGLQTTWIKERRRRVPRARSTVNERSATDHKRYALLPIPSHTHAHALIGSDGSSSSSEAEEDEDPMAAYIRAERKKAKAKKKGKKVKGEAGETKEERRARKAEKRAKKAARGQVTEGNVKKERVESPGRAEGDRSRARDYRPVSRSRSPPRRSASHHIKSEPEEDTKPSLSDLRRGDDRAQRREGRRSQTPPFVGRVKREPSPPTERERYSSTRDYQERQHTHRDSASDRRNDHRPRDDYPSRRTETDWRAGRDTRPDDSYRGGGDRPAEGDYASWQSRRDVERVMRRVGDRDAGDRRWRD